MENEMPNLVAVERLEHVEEVVGREPNPDELIDIINYLENELFVFHLHVYNICCSSDWM